jgi:hypothetical protein
VNSKFQAERRSHHFFIDRRADLQSNQKKAIMAFCLATLIREVQGREIDPISSSVMGFCFFGTFFPGVNNQSTLSPAAYLNPEPKRRSHEKTTFKL